MRSEKQCEFDMTHDENLTRRMAKIFLGRINACERTKEHLCLLAAKIYANDRMKFNKMNQESLLFWVDHDLSDIYHDGGEYCGMKESILSKGD